MSATPAAGDLGSRLRGLDRRSRRRRLVNKLMVAISTLAALLAVALLAVIVFTVVVKGIGAINWDFFTKPTPQLGVGQSQGAGVANAIVGTLIIVAIATALAVPIGILVAIFTSEFASVRQSRFVRLIARRAERRAVDRDRHLHLRAARRRAVARRPGSQASPWRSSRSR